MSARLFGLGLVLVAAVGCVYSGPLDLSKAKLVAGVSNIAPLPSSEPALGTVLTIRGATYANGTNCPLYGGGFGIRRTGVTGPDSFLYGDFVAGQSSKLYFRTPISAPFKYYEVGTYQGPGNGPPPAGQPVTFTLSQGFALVGEAAGGTISGAIAGGNSPCFIYMSVDSLPSPVPSPLIAVPS
jgi:hypothetical protein